MNPPSAESTEKDSDPRLVVEALCCMRDDRVLFEAIGFTLTPGGIIQLEGPNGSGKTTLLRAICGLAPIEGGHVSWCGTPRDEVLDEFLAALTYVGHVPGVKRDLTPRENLATSLALTTMEPAMPADTAFDRVGLDGLADTPLRRLSAGQVRRAALARLLVAPTPLWLLDEPLTALDADGKRVLERLLADHAAAGGMILISTHHPLDLADTGAQRIRLGD
ncbi:MAG: cytochrome c biogenesis heme-transporting ATPase CcmA [Halofilum sp. (in: g-proteobacteria)]|nr:cytochrome c biogenesis heme-transporting ATPase CcmA [Halofilum sp. (in: g-proteobacteria)]